MARSARKQNRDTPGQCVFRFVDDLQHENAALRAEIERLRALMRRRAQMAFAFGEMLMRDAEPPWPAPEP